MANPAIVPASGWVLLEVLIQCFSQGVLFAQAIKYYGRFGLESRSLNMFVGIIMLLSSLQTAQEIYKIWRIVVQQLSWATSNIAWSEILLNGFIGSLCQGHLVRRCWKATNKRIWVLGILAIFNVTAFAANVFLTVTVSKAYKEIVPKGNLLRSARFIKAIDVAFTYWTSASLVLDSVVTAILVVYLIHMHMGLGYLDRAVNHFLNITWESAALPWLSMLIAVTIFHIRATSDYNIVLFFTIITGKLYGHGLLRTLNSRQELRHKINSSDTGPQSLEGHRSYDQAEDRTETLGYDDVVNRAERVDVHRIFEIGRLDVVDVNPSFLTG